MAPAMAPAADALEVKSIVAPRGATPPSQPDPRKAPASRCSWETWADVSMEAPRTLSSSKAVNSGSLPPILHLEKTFEASGQTHTPPKLSVSSCLSFLVRLDPLG